MSQQISTALVQAYKANIELQFQQRGSRLRNTVMAESQNAEYAYYDRIGTVEARERTTRHADVVYGETPHTRRRVQWSVYDFADLIDEPDRLRMLADPTSAYAQNAAFAIGRKLDSVIIAAATGTAYTGKTGSTAVTFPTATQRVAVDFVETGAATDSNLTIGKLREALEILHKNEAIMEGEPLTCVLSASQMTALLRTTEITSSDYNVVKALVNGEVNSFLGMNFVRTELLNKTGDDRSVLVYPRSAIVVGMGKDLTVSVDPLPQKYNSVQVLASAMFGATRMWEEKVVEILCDETK